jgi:hypothetical protein
MSNILSVSNRMRVQNMTRTNYVLSKVCAFCIDCFAIQRLRLTLLDSHPIRDRKYVRHHLHLYNFYLSVKMILFFLFPLAKTIRQESSQNMTRTNRMWVQNMTRTNRMWVQNMTRTNRMWVQNMTGTNRMRVQNMIADTIGIIAFLCLCFLLCAVILW